MNWDAIGAVGELLGSLAVLVTLAYLAVQVRHAREQMARAARDARFDALRQLSALLVTTPQLRHAQEKLSHHLGQRFDSTWMGFVIANGGTADDAALLGSQQFMRWSIAEQTLGNLEDLLPGERMQAEGFYRRIYGGQGIEAQYYRLVARPHLNPDVVRIIDDLLARPD